MSPHWTFHGLPLKTESYSDAQTTTHPYLLRTTRFRPMTEGCVPRVLAPTSKLGGHVTFIVHLPILNALLATVVVISWIPLEFTTMTRTINYHES